MSRSGSLLLFPLLAGSCDHITTAPNLVVTKLYWSGSHRLLGEETTELCIGDLIKPKETGVSWTSSNIQKIALTVQVCLEKILTILL